MRHGMKGGHQDIQKFGSKHDVCSINSFDRQFALDIRLTKCHYFKARCTFRWWLSNAAFSNTTAFAVIQSLPCRPLPTMFVRFSFLLSLSLWISLSSARTKNPKRGIGYAGDVPGDVINANQTNSVISWDYNWASIPPDYLATANLTYIPMQWGSVGSDSFASDVQAQGANIILVHAFSLNRLSCFAHNTQGVQRTRFYWWIQYRSDGCCKLMDAIHTTS